MLSEQDRRRRGRPRLRWEDCVTVKRDVRKAGEEEDWKKKTRDRGGWKRLSDEVVKKLRAAPHRADKGEKRKRESCFSYVVNLSDSLFGPFPHPLSVLNALVWRSSHLTTTDW